MRLLLRSHAMPFKTSIPYKVVQIQVKLAMKVKENRDSLYNNLGGIRETKDDSSAWKCSRSLFKNSLPLSSNQMANYLAPAKLRKSSTTFSEEKKMNIWFLGYTYSLSSRYQTFPERQNGNKMEY